MIAPNGLRAKLAVHPIATPPTREEEGGGREKGGEKISEEEGEGGGREKEREKVERKGDERIEE